jgi:biotin operon repressor
MMRMHARLQSGRYSNCRKLAQELEVSSKTVQRDLDFMRYRLGLPIEYDQLHFGFYYTEPVSSFPNVDNHSNYVKDVSAHAGDSYQIARAMVNIYPNLSATTAFHLQRRFA